MLITTLTKEELEIIIDIFSKPEYGEHDRFIRALKLIEEDGLTINLVAE